MQYIESSVKSKKKDECIFCRAVKGRDDSKYYVINRFKTCFSLLNIFPYNNGHIMISPYKHVADLDDMNTDEHADLMALVVYTRKLLTKAFKPQGFNIGINLGQVAGAGIVDHVHIHVVPRWNGDTNFMPVISDTKIVSQSLKDTYDALIKIDKKSKK